MNAIKKEIKLAFVENKYLIIASALIFFASFILGFAFESYLFSYLNPIVEDFTNKIQSGVISITFQSIFFNNILVVLRMFVSGLLFCSSSLILAFNGFFTGYFLATVPDLTYALMLVIPHGIFEFPSCILACASGCVLFKFAYRLIKTFISEKDKKFIERLVYAYSENFNVLLQAFILLAISSVLMVIAGVIEVYVTLPLGNFLMSLIR